MTADPFLEHEPHSFVELSKERFVFWTGRVAVGLRYEPRPPDQGSHAEMMQRLLLTPVPKVWHECPREFYVSRGLVQRLRDFLNR